MRSLATHLYNIRRPLPCQFTHAVGSNEIFSCIRKPLAIARMIDYGGMLYEYLPGPANQAVHMLSRFTLHSISAQESETAMCTASRAPQPKAVLLANRFILCL